MSTLEPDWTGDGEHLGELLSGFVDGQLRPSERGFVLVHLNECSRCERELDEIRTTRKALRYLPAIDLPTGYLDRVIDQVASSQVLSDELQVSDLQAHRANRRSRRNAPLGAAAAVMALLVTATFVSRADSGDSLTQVSQASRQHVSAVASLVGSGSGSGVIRQDTAPFAMPEALEAVPEQRETTSRPVDVLELPAPYQAPSTLAGGYVLVDALEISDGLHLMYAKGDLGLSIFLEEGHIDEDDLPPGGTDVAFGSGKAWRWESPGIAGRVVVGENGGLAITAIGDEPGDSVLRAARSFPGPKAFSNLERLRRFGEKVLERLDLTS